MATKCTVAMVGGIVIVVSIAVLIIISLTSPRRCIPSGETSQTSTAEEASDRQPMDNSSVTETLPEGNFTPVTRRILIVPERKCNSGERRDSSGNCRKEWLLG